MINPRSGPPAAAPKVARYLHRQIVRDQVLQRTDPELEALAQAVADYEMTYSEALSELMGRAIRDGISIDTDLEKLEWRLGTALADAADRIQRAQFLPAEDAGIDGSTPGPVLRADTDERLAALLKVEPGAELTLAEATNLMQALTIDGERVPGRRYYEGGAHKEPVGYLDLSIAAGKPASIAWAFAEPGERALIFNAHVRSVETVMRHIESSIGQVRRGAGGSLGNEPGHITYLQFHHGTARPTSHPGDPHLHTHVVVPNVVLSRTSDRVGALHSWDLHGKIDTMRKVYGHSLTTKLQAAGIDAHYDHGRSEVRLSAIPDRISQVFSKRSEVAKTLATDYLAKRGIDMAELGSLQQGRHRTKAVQVSRWSAYSNAEHPLTVATVQSWQAQAKQANWQPTTALTPAGQAHQRLVAVHRQARATVAQATARIQAMTPAQHTRHHELQQIRQLEETLRFHRGHGLRPVDDLTRKL